MNTSLVLTVLGVYRTGLVDIFARNGGSSQESWMARLAGQFAGILLVKCPEENRGSFKADLAALSELGLTITFAKNSKIRALERKILSLDITGLDEPGIVKPIASALAELGVNVEELQTSLESAPMPGHPLFCTRGKVSLPDGLHPSGLIESLENVGAGLNVDLK